MALNFNELLPGRDIGFGLTGAQDWDVGWMKGWKDKLNKAATTTSSGGGAAADAQANAVRAGLSPVQLIKPGNESLYALLQSIAGSMGKSGGQNAIDLDAFTKAFNAAQKTNEADTTLQSGAANRPFTGEFRADLSKARGDWADNATKDLADIVGKSKAALSAFETKQAGGIEDLFKRSGAQLAGYENRVGGEISAEEAARQAMRDEYAAAERRNRDLGYNRAASQVAGSLAPTMGAGAASSSFFGRTLAGLRGENEAALASDIANRRLADYEATRGQRASLSDLLGRFGREDVESRGRGLLNLGQNTYGETARILGLEGAGRNRITDMRSALPDVQAEQAAQMAWYGRPQSLRTEQARNYMIPATFRESLIAQQLGNLRSAAPISSELSWMGYQDRQPFSSAPLQLPPVQPAQPMGNPYADYWQTGGASGGYVNPRPVAAARDYRSWANPNDAFDNQNMNPAMTEAQYYDWINSMNIPEYGY